MIDISFDMMSGIGRPIIELNDIFSGCNALLDTGALFPLWTKNLKLLESIGGKLYKSNVPFSGFGGKAYQYSRIFYFQRNYVQ